MQHDADLTDVTSAATECEDVGEERRTYNQVGAISFVLPVFNQLIRYSLIEKLCSACLCLIIVILFTLYPSLTKSIFDSEASACRSLLTVV